MHRKIERRIFRYSNRRRPLPVSVAVHVPSDVDRYVLTYLQFHIFLYLSVHCLLNYLLIYLSMTKQHVFSR